MATSGTYNFLSTTSQPLIDEAWELAGLLPDVITHQKIITAQRSANLILTSWINKGYNLWTSFFALLNLVPNQLDYQIANTVSDVIDVSLRTFQRPLGGTAFSSNGGNAANVFGGVGGCAQNAPNGYISYNYGAGIQNEVVMVGVQSAATLVYTLVFEYSADNVTWSDTRPGLSAESTYTALDTVWLDLLIPASAQYFRIRETGGSTLNMNQLFFSTNTVDTPMSRISGSEWMSYPNKYFASRPTQYYFDRKDQVSRLFIWPLATPTYQVVFYRYIKMLQDIGQMTNGIQIPARFYDAFCLELSYRLHMKKGSEIDYNRLDRLKKDAEDAFSQAYIEDSEDVPLRIIPSYMSGGA